MPDVRYGSREEERSCRSSNTFNGTAKTYTLWVDENHNGTADSGESRTVNIPGTVSVSLGGGAIQFAPSGRLANANARPIVTLQNNRGKRYVIVLPSGLVDYTNIELTSGT